MNWEIRVTSSAAPWKNQVNFLLPRIQLKPQQYWERSLEVWICPETRLFENELPMTGRTVQTSDTACEDKDIGSQCKLSYSTSITTLSMFKTVHQAIKPLCTVQQHMILQGSNPRNHRWESTKSIEAPLRYQISRPSSHHKGSERVRERDSDNSSTSLWSLFIGQVPSSTSSELKFKAFLFSNRFIGGPSESSRSTSSRVECSSSLRILIAAFLIFSGALVDKKSLGLKTGPASKNLLSQLQGSDGSSRMPFIFLLGRSSLELAPSERYLVLLSLRNWRSSPYESLPPTRR